jgi:acid phosphatase family membrane protein YuiD
MNDYLIFNKVLVSSILAWFISQTMKVFILAHKEKKV